MYDINFPKLYVLDSSLYSRSVRESVRWQTQFPSESVDKVRALFPSLEPTKNRTNIQYLVMISNNRVVHTEIKLTQLGLYCRCFFRTQFLPLRLNLLLFQTVLFIDYANQWHIFVIPDQSKMLRYHHKDGIDNICKNLHSKSLMQSFKNFRFWKKLTVQTQTNLIFDSFRKKTQSNHIFFVQHTRSAINS